MRLPSSLLSKFLNSFRVVHCPCEVLSISCILFCGLTSQPSDILGNNIKQYLLLESNTRRILEQQSIKSMRTFFLGATIRFHGRRPARSSSRREKMAVKRSLRVCKKHVSKIVVCTPPDKNIVPTADMNPAVRTCVRTYVRAQKWMRG
jgi:hypothetical protein